MNTFIKIKNKYRFICVYLQITCECKWIYLQIKYNYQSRESFFSVLMDTLNNKINKTPKTQI